MRARAVVLTAILGTAAGWAGPATAVDHGRWEKTYTTAAHPTLRLRTDDGHVRLRSWEQRAVSVRVSTVGWPIGEHGVRIEEHQNGNQVELEALTPRFEFHFGFVVRSLTIEVWTPREADLVLESGDGDLDLEGVRGRISARSGDGRIVVDDVGGRIELRSGDGRIVGTGLDGTLDAHTGDGAIRVAGRFDGLMIGSGDGGVTAQVDSGSRLETEWSLSTTDGRLDLRVPADLKAVIDAHTGDGAIDIDLPLTLTSTGRHEVRGALNGGGPPLRLRSGDGSLRVARR